MIRRVLLVLLAGAATAGAQLAPVDSASRWVDSIFAPYASARVPGCAVGVTRNGALELAKGYGVADLGTGAPITPSTPFYIASLSKQFTAMSIVLLAQEGKLSLDDSLRRWVPEVPSFGATITLRELLHHTSGLRDYFTLLAVSGWPADGPLTERQFLDLMHRQKSLNFQPGDEFLYSNSGYVLLAIVVERASGESLRAFAARHIFAPLGMTHTEFRDDHREVIPGAAVGYQPAGGAFRVSQPEFDVVGDGGAYSTVEDLAKWNDNFRTGVVGGAAAVAAMQTRGRLNDGQTIPYALALSVGRHAGLTTYSHAGAYAGYRSAMLRIPEAGLSVITLCNTASAPATLAEQVADVFLGTAEAAPAVALPELAAGSWLAGTAQTAESPTPRQRADRLADLGGAYYSEELDLHVTLAGRDGVLVLRRPHASEIRFVPLGDDLFTSSDKMLLRVLRDDRADVTGFTLTINRVRDLEFTKSH
ncbi:MAG TPA: serine hydrolase domain-containing protein [Gemmatimonadaceae bacterium]|nr:serine hydrolase domain-containing protein [Gemmatimonadaceae bacterium]